MDVFLNEEWPALGDSEALEKQLEQCTVRKQVFSHNFLFNCCSVHRIFQLPVISHEGCLNNVIKSVPKV